MGRLKKLTKRQRVYAAYLRSDEWRTLRTEVLSRDGWKCIRCGSAEKLHVHHKTYARFMNEPLADLQTLCDACHREEHGLKPNGKKRKGKRISKQKAKRAMVKSQMHASVARRRAELAQRIKARIDKSSGAFQSSPAAPRWNNE